MLEPYILDHASSCCGRLSSCCSLCQHITSCSPKSASFSFYPHFLTNDTVIPRVWGREIDRRSVSATAPSPTPAQPGNRSPADDILTECVSFLFLMQGWLMWSLYQVTPLGGVQFQWKFVTYRSRQLERRAAWSQFKTWQLTFRKQSKIHN